MVKLSGLVMRLLVDEHGVKGTLKLLSNPIFFQSLNNLIGMDWDSSGSTTVTTAALKEALAEVKVGVAVVGGKGPSALNVPAEIERVSEAWGLDAEALKMVSRLVAKVDNVALQDGYRLYHHTMFIGEDGSWAVVQQGMNEALGLARRYHWWMETSFINNPHEGIVGVRGEWALNMVSKVSEGARSLIVDLVNQGVTKVVRDVEMVKAILRSRRNKSIIGFLGAGGQVGSESRGAHRVGTITWSPTINKHHEAVLRGLRGSRDFKEVLLARGLGPSLMLALALVAEVVYREPVDWSDPANIDPRKFAFAVGGKDGSPYPVNREVYDALISVLGALVDRVRREHWLRTHLRHLAQVAARLGLPLDLVRPTPG